MDYLGKITNDYPDYDYNIGGWDISVDKNGVITDDKGVNYPYIFWEGLDDYEFDFNHNEGFVVESDDVEQFLIEKLDLLGLNYKEKADFVTFWSPILEKNEFNYVHFIGQEEYGKLANLEVTPKPDSILRVFMVYKSLGEKIDIEEQEIKSFERKGFSVVEWGGSELK